MLCLDALLDIAFPVGFVFRACERVLESDSVGQQASNVESLLLLGNHVRYVVAQGIAVGNYYAAHGVYNAVQGRNISVVFVYLNAVYEDFIHAFPMRHRQFAIVHVGAKDFCVLCRREVPCLYRFSVITAVDDTAHHQKFADRVSLYTVGKTVP